MQSRFARAICAQPSMQASSVTMTSACVCHQLPSLNCASANTLCEVASRMRVTTPSHAVMRAQLKHRNFRLRVGFGKQADALHVVGGGRRAGNVDADGHGVAVVHQAAIVNSTRPACTGAPPVKTLMAMRNISGMAWACSNRCQITRPVPPCSVLCSQRRRFAFMRSFQRLQIGDHVFDLLRVQSRASSCAGSTGAGRPPAAAIAPL